MEENDKSDLLSQLEFLQHEISELNASKKRIVTKIYEKIAEKRKLEEELEAISPEEFDVKITDHAIVRFLERVLGVDIVKIREQIVDDYKIVQFIKKNRIVDLDEIKKRIVSEGRIKEAIKILADGSFPSEDGEFILRVKSKSVVTIIKNEKEK